MATNQPIQSRSFLTALRKPTNIEVSIVKVGVFLLCLIPLGQLVFGGVQDVVKETHDNLGANPIEFITRALGTWTLRFLLISLLITPLRQLFKAQWLVRLRRMLGLYAFFYGVLHLATYLWLDQSFDWAAIVKDIVKRPFVTAGFAALVIMLPLAITSNKVMIKKLGGQRWTRLHRSVYAVAIIGVIHYWWLVKKDLTLPVIYAALLSLLLGYRVLRAIHDQRRKAAIP